MRAKGADCFKFPFISLSLYPFVHLILSLEANDAMRKVFNICGGAYGIDQIGAVTDEKVKDTQFPFLQISIGIAVVPQ
jgi:hypothetical protein